MKTLKILHVYKSYYPETKGGVERVIQMLSAETAEMGCENRLVTCTKQKKAYCQKSNLLEVFYYPKTIELASSPFSYALWKAFPEHVQWADVIHYHFPWPMADLLHCGHRVNKPSLMTYHSDVVRQKYLKYCYQPLMNHFLNKTDCIVATSQNYVNTSLVLHNYLNTINKVRVIPIGIDPEHYKINLENQKKWKEKLPKSFILFVGVLRYYKGLEYLLEAINDLNINLVIAGGGPLLETLKNQAKKLQNTQVIFTESLSDEDLSSVYSLAKCLVIPASHRSEAYCIALVEGLMFGLPLVSTEIGTGTSFVNAQNETGLVVESRNSEALKKAIFTLINNPVLLKKMSEASRARFKKLFTAKSMAKKYCDLYCELTKNV